ncbi:MAG TPA: RNA polymerase sigma factor SigZ [Gemmataceae bacterium]
MTGLPPTEAIWSRLSADLRRFIRRRVPDDHTADDLLQETFLRIHRNIGTLRGGERVAAWVYRIARNVIHDHHRQRPRRTAALDDSVPAPAPDPRAELRARAGLWLDELVRQLPETYRDAVRLSEVEGLTHQEVADRLGLSLSGAKSRVRRGRAMLREALDACCRFEFDRRGNLTGCDPKPGRTACRACAGPDAPGPASPRCGG